MAMFKNTFFGMVQKQGLIYNTTRAMKEFGVWGTIKKLYCKWWSTESRAEAVQCPRPCPVD